MPLRHRTANPRSEPQYVQTHMRVYRDAYGTAMRLMGVTWDVTKEVLHASELESKSAHESALFERLSVTTQAAGIAPWEFDIKSDCFSWHGPRPPCFGLDHVPLQDYFRTLTTIVLAEDREILLQTPRAGDREQIGFLRVRFPRQGHRRRNPPYAELRSHHARRARTRPLHRRRNLGRHPRRAYHGNAQGPRERKSPARGAHQYCHRERRDLLLGTRLGRAPLPMARESDRGSELSRNLREPRRRAHRGAGVAGGPARVS